MINIHCIQEYISVSHTYVSPTHTLEHIHKHTHTHTHTSTPTSTHQHTHTSTHQIISQAYLLNDISGRVHHSIHHPGGGSPPYFITDDKQLFTCTREGIGHRSHRYVGDIVQQYTACVIYSHSHALLLEV